MNGKVYVMDEEVRRRPVSERPLSQTVNEAASEFREFLETRIAMLRSEMREKTAMLKSAGPLVVVAAVFGFTAFLLLTGAAVALLTVAFLGNVYGPFLALIIIGVLYGIIGGVGLALGMNRINQSLLPERTLTVLKEDKVWLQSEAKVQEAKIKDAAVQSREVRIEP